jgi:hypothetical protein
MKAINRRNTIQMKVRCRETKWGQVKWWAFVSSWIQLQLHSSQVTCVTAETVPPASQRGRKLSDIQTSSDKTSLHRLKKPASPNLRFITKSRTDVGPLTGSNHVYAWHSTS